MEKLKPIFSRIIAQRPDLKAESITVTSSYLNAWMVLWTWKFGFKEITLSADIKNRVRDCINSWAGETDEAALTAEFSRLIRVIWEVRPDLKKEYDISTLTGQQQMANWFRRAGRYEYDLQDLPLYCGKEVSTQESDRTRCASIPEYASSYPKRYATELERMCTIKHEPASGNYNIILTLDKNLYNPMFVLLYAMSINFMRPIELFVLHSDFDDQMISILGNFCDKIGISLHLHKVNTDVFKVFGKHTLPQPVFFYFLSHSFLPNYIEKALYLDIDILPLKDISWLYDIDFEDSWLVAANEYIGQFFNRYFIDRINKKFVYKHLYSSETIYNSGVLLLNLKKFRENNVDLNTYISLLKREDFTVGTADQMIINRLTGTNIKLVPKLWFNCWAGYSTLCKNLFCEYLTSNETSHFFLKNEELENSIIHFTAGNTVKPWSGLESVSRGEYKFFMPNDARGKNIQAWNDTFKYLQIWWELAENIPPKIFCELVASSVTRCMERRRQENRVYSPANGSYLGLTNIAPLGKACQSSISQWSQGPDDANNLLIGKLKDGEDFACHTRHDPISWWMVDLQDYYKIKLVKLFKRDRFRERYSPEKLEIFFSQDGKHWVDYGHPQESAEVDAYVLSLSGLLHRFVKVQVKNQPIHFKRIGIYI